MVSRRLLQLGALFPLALAASACGAGDVHRPLAERTDSAGVEIVTSPGEDAPLGWTLERLFVLGGEEEGPESFYQLYPGMVGTDRAGRIYVLDYNAHHVVVFDSTGAFVRTLGGNGGGPGEVKEPGALSVTPDGAVTIFDFGKGALVRFAADGAVLPEEAFLHFPFNRQRHFAVTSGGVIVSSWPDITGAEWRLNRLSRFHGGDTVALAEISVPPSTMAMYERCGGGLRQPPLFSPEIIWDAHEERVALNARPEYAVDVVDGGQVVQSVRRALQPARTTRELALAELGEGEWWNFGGRGRCLIRSDEIVEKRGFADTVPLIRNLLLSPEGELWVERRVPGSPDTSPIDIFDPSGAYLGTLPAGTPFPMLLLPGGRVGVVEKDESDVQRLAIMRVVRGG
jgi:hypothetical protein